MWSRRVNAGVFGILVLGKVEYLTRHYVGARRSLTLPAAASSTVAGLRAYVTLNTLPLLDQREDLGTCDRRARSRSEHFGTDERATKWQVVRSA